MSRLEAWSAVWNERDEDRADWNGYEDCFDTLADYERWVADVADVITLELGLSADDDVLDMGCGSGRFASRLAPGVRSILAVDYSRPALAVAETRRAAPNVSYQWADLNDYDPAILVGRTKAYASASMYYLKSVPHVLDLVAALVAGGTDVMLLELPDADIVETRDRDYDRETYSHLSFREEDFRARFPRARFVRGRCSYYVNDASRFAVVVPADGGGDQQER